jgi:hypothetical protein
VLGAARENSRRHARDFELWQVAAANESGVVVAASPLRPEFFSGPEEGFSDLGSGLELGLQLSDVVGERDGGLECQGKTLEIGLVADVDPAFLAAAAAAQIAWGLVAGGTLGHARAAMTAKPVQPAAKAPSASDTLRFMRAGAAHVPTRSTAKPAMATGARA